MKAAILSIGDELLLGSTVNTNASWLSEKLYLLGAEVIRVVTVGDNRKPILQVLNQLSNEADIILTSGGLGPTRDDITKLVLCEFWACKPVFDRDIFAGIQHFYRQRGMEMTEGNKRQANVPEDAVPLPNRNGVAPGFWKSYHGKLYIVLPGVPAELKTIFSEHALPRLEKAYNWPVLATRHVHTAGIRESVLAARLEDYERQLPPAIRLAYLPKPGMVSLRLTGRGKDRQMLDKELDGQVEQLQKRLSKYVYGTGNRTLPEALGQLLRKRQLTLTTAESCTGGYIGHLLTSVSGSSNYYQGGIVSYTNTLKHQLLGVKKTTLQQHGAVSRQTVLEMAAGAAARIEADCAIAVSGIAGPSGGTDEKPVGTVWIAVRVLKKQAARKFSFGSERTQNIHLSGVMGMELLRRLLTGSLEA